MTMLFLLCFSASTLYAQESIKGQVVDELGIPLPGVTVIVDGTTNGAAADIDGNFTISASTGDVLSFSYVGFKTKRVTVGSSKTLSVVMEEDTEALEEVVVIGYGAQKKKEVTGAVANVGAEAISKTATADLATALQGKVAGVNIQAANGRPGAAANVQIRGIGSLNGSDPLYVVDGIPFNGNPNIAPEQIESIDILKDGASASIYGVRASNGVILITTKKGKAGKAKVNLSTYTGIQNITSGTPLLNTKQAVYVEEIKLQALGRDPLIFSFNPNLFENDSDFVGDVQNNNAVIRNYNLEASGGVENLTLNLNANHFNQEGVLINSDFNRTTTRLTAQYKKDKLKIFGTIGLTEENRTREPFALYEYSISQAPYNPALSDIQSAGQNTVLIPAQNEILFSFLSRELETVNESKTNSSNVAISLEYEFLKGLSNKVRVGRNTWNFRSKLFQPQYLVFNFQGDLSPAASRQQSLLNERFTFNQSDVFENILTYKTSLGKHNFTLTGVLTYEKQTSKQLGVGVIFSEEASNDIQTLGAGSEPIAPTSYNETRAIAGKIGRLLYNYDGKYLFSASLRRDGSSVFNKDFRYGTFYGLSAGWNIHEENFFNVDAISSLKLRGSYAELGNQGAAPFSGQEVIETGANYLFGSEEELTFGQTQRRLVNPALTWETNISTNIGFDLGMFNNKLSITAEYYEKNIEDMLLRQRLPASLGTYQTRDINAFSSLFVNAGDMTNKGIEVSVNYSDETDYGLKYSIGGTFTKNKNEITNLNGITRGFGGGRPSITIPGVDETTFLAEGFEAGAFFLLQHDGIIKTNEELTAYRQIDPSAQLGDARYIDVLTVDTNGDGVPDAGNNSLGDEDRVYAGSGQSDFEAGLNLSLEYKNFDFYVQGFYSYGSEIFNGAKLAAYANGRHEDLYYAWTPQNPNSDIATPRQGRTHNNVRARSDYFLEDGTYLRIRTLSLGYTIPTKSFGIEKARVYLSSVNPFTFTKYEGFDPEVGGDGLLTRGVDIGNYPVTRQFILGVELSF